MKPWFEKIRTFQKSISTVKKKERKGEDGAGGDNNDDEDEGQEDEDSENELYNEETRKVKVLKIIREKIRVNGNEYLKA